MRRKINEDGEEGELEGVRLPLFDYTSKNILTITNYNKKIKEEITRVKTMKHPEKAGWIVKARRNRGIIYETNCVRRLSGIREERNRAQKDPSAKEMAFKKALVERWESSAK